MTAPTMPAIQPDRFEKGKKRLFAGISRSYTFPNVAGIPMQWMEFGQHFGKVPNQVGKCAYGLSFDMKQTGFDYLVGVEVSSFDGIPGALAQHTLAPANFAVFKHPGHVSTLAATHTSIWQQWFPSSGKQPGAGANLEVYMEDFNPLTGFGGIEIWVPVKD